MNREQLGWHVPAESWDSLKRHTRTKWGCTDRYLRREAEQAMREFADLNQTAIEAEANLREYLRLQEDYSSSDAVPVPRTQPDHSDTSKVPLRIHAPTVQEFRKVADEHYNENYGAVFSLAIKEYVEGGALERIRQLSEQVKMAGISSGTTKDDYENIEVKGSDRPGKFSSSPDSGTSDGTSGGAPTGHDENIEIDWSDRHSDFSSSSESGTTADTSAEMYDGEFIVDVLDRLPDRATDPPVHANQLRSEIALQALENDMPDLISSQIDSDYPRKKLAQVANDEDARIAGVDEYCERIGEQLGLVPHPDSTKDLYITDSARDELYYWDNLDKDDRVEALCRYMLLDAVNNGNAAAKADYNDIMNLFEDNLFHCPSQDYAFKAMRRAEDEYDGFYISDKKSPKRLKVTLADADPEIKQWVRQKIQSQNQLDAERGSVQDDITTHGAGTAPDQEVGADD